MDKKTMDYFRDLQTPDFMDTAELDVFADNIKDTVCGLKVKNIDLAHQVGTLTHYLEGHYKEYILQGACETAITEINNTIEVLSVLRENINDILFKMDEKSSGKIMEEIGE